MADAAPHANGETCDLCGRLYLTVYRLPNDVWERLSFSDAPGGGLLCPTCADRLARQIGIELFWSAGVGEYPEATTP